MEHKKYKIKNIFECLVLVIAGGLLFTLPNPNILFKNGIAIFAWVMYVPFLFLIKKTSLKTCWLFGGLYGMACVGFYAYWLYNYNPVCLYIALAISFLGIALLSLALKGLQFLFPANAWIMQFLLLCSFEYLRTLGFTGIHYGLAAYTQWNSKLLLQGASLGGVFLLNMFIIFSSALIYAFVSKLFDKKRIGKKMISDNELYDGASYVNYVSQNEKELAKTSLKVPFVFLCVWAASLIFLLVYGKASQVSKDEISSYKTVTVAAIQHNDDPHQNGMENFNDSIQRLISLTEEALEINPGIELVVWPETAVVPSVIYNYYRTDNSDRTKLINYLLNYLNNSDCDFIIGNQHIDVNTGTRKIYNTAMLFTPGQNVIPPTPAVNSKIKLVPFSEYFPYQKYFPHIYKSLLAYEKFFLDPGKEITLFNTKGLCVYSPICFENTFPDLCRTAYQKGARSLFCLVSDAWSQSLACQYQHLAMAKFRAVENRIPVVISSVTGQTAFIDMNGQLTAMAQPFTSTYAVAQVPVVPLTAKPTVYNRIGDIFGLVPLFLFIILLIIRSIIVIIRHTQKRK
ncbi:MAG: apolipoprotein N-acyltransferase [Treponema sp.]|nr:apolipoprotein N-acyltransferase [Treponema sp.]